MWAALLGTLVLIGVGGWYTVNYASNATAPAPPAAAVAANAAPTPAARAGGAVVSSSADSRALATSAPAPVAATSQAAPAARAPDWFGTIASLPALAIRGITGPAPAPSQHAGAAARQPEPGREPPPPVVVDGAGARATAIALIPTPNPELDDAGAPAAPRSGGSYVIRPTPPPSARRTPSNGTPNPTPGPGTPGAGIGASAAAVGTSTPIGTPAPDARTGSASDNQRALDSATGRAPAVRRTPRPVWTRRPDRFPTPSTRPTPGAKPTPGGATYRPPPIKNGDDKWGVGVYKDSNRVLDGLKDTQPGVILLMDPSEGWAKKLRQQFPNAFIVGRRYKPEDQQPLDNPDQQGRDFADYVAELAVPLRGVVDAWESYNEVLGSEPSQDYANYNRFQVAFAKRLQNGYGVAAIAGNDGSGALDPADYPTYFAEAIKASQFFGVHAYSPPGSSSMQQDAEWNALRYRKVHDALEAAGIHNVTMVITESGLGDGFREGITTDEHMADDFGWFTGELRKDPYMVGQAAFGVFDATGAWPKFDLTDSAVLKLLPQLIKQ